MTLQPRTAWYANARSMKAEGKKLGDIAKALGKSKTAVQYATKGTHSRFDDIGRKNTGLAQGMPQGNLRRIAIGFPPDLVMAINDIAVSEDKSFSFAVVTLVQEAIEIRSKRQAA